MKLFFTKKISLYAFVALLIGSSCNKDDDWTDARILDYRGEATDYCEILLVEVGGDSYAPVSMEDRYAKHGLEIRIKYTLLGDSARCGFGGAIRHQKIDIKQIKRK